MSPTSNYGDRRELRGALRSSVAQLGRMCGARALTERLVRERAGCHTLPVRRSGGAGQRTANQRHLPLFGHVFREPGDIDRVGPHFHRHDRFTLESQRSAASQFSFFCRDPSENRLPISKSGGDLGDGNRRGSGGRRAQ